MSDWSAWIGREQRATGHLDIALAKRWCATFDRDVPEDGVMPQGIHLCLCTPDAHTQTLGEDGHPRRENRKNCEDGEDSFLPPVPLPRRMWASSAIQFHAPITAGAQIERISRIASAEQKSGRRGQMVFIDIDHETSANGVRAVAERQTLVYLESVASNAPFVPHEPADTAFDPSCWDEHQVLAPDEKLLFRYSALSFNTHRIHYDAPYARNVERYRNLVVHGPLTASLLLQLAGRHCGENRLASFAFRGLSPAIVNEALHLVLRTTGDDMGNDMEIGAFAKDGRQITCASTTALL